MSIYHLIKNNTRSIIEHSISLLFENKRNKARPIIRISSVSIFSGMSDLKENPFLKKSGEKEPKSNFGSLSLSLRSFFEKTSSLSFSPSNPENLISASFISGF